MKRLIDNFTGLYIFSFAAIGVLFPLIGQYLDRIGFTGTEIGIVTASATAIGILSNSFWGSVYHKTNRSKKLILILCVITGLLSLLLMLINQFEFFLLLYIIIFFFENPIFPLIDATTIETNYPFGAARKWGAVGFALGIGVAGTVADHVGLISIFPMFMAFLLLTAVFLIIFLNKRRDFPSQAIRDERIGQGVGALRMSKVGCYNDLLHNKKYMALLASLFFYMGPTMAHNTYFSFLYIDVGGTVAGMGLVLLLMVISEMPFMAWTERICEKFTLEKMIVIAMFVSALRFLWYSTNPDPSLLAVTFFIQGFTNGIILVEGIKYIYKIVGQSMVSLAIPLFTALSSNCGTITCQLVGGIIVEHYGGGGVYLFYGLFNIVGISIYMISGLQRQRIVRKFEQ